MYLIKQALLFHEKHPEAEIYLFYMDIRAFGKGFEEFYNRTQLESGITFVRGRVAEIYENPDNEPLYREIELGSGQIDPINDNYETVYTNLTTLTFNVFDAIPPYVELKGATLNIDVWLLGKSLILKKGRQCGSSASCRDQGLTRGKLSSARSRTIRSTELCSCSPM